MSSPLSTRTGATESMRGAGQELQDIKERRNWIIHQLYVRQERIDCLSVIEAQLRDTDGTCEYALYVKALLKRSDGQLTESLALLNTAVLVNPENITSRRQLGRGFQLLGRYEDAIATYQDTARQRSLRGMPEDWELGYDTGMCYLALKRYTEAVEAFMSSIVVLRQDETFMQLGRTLVAMANYDTAVDVYLEGVQFSPNNAALLALVGQLYLRIGDTDKAFSYLGRCLAVEPTNSRALLALCSVAQDAGDVDTALHKYRIAIANMPNSAQVWNNIGACYFAKHNNHAAVTCLRRSLFLSPLEWRVQYNCGMAYLAMGRHVSALQHLSAAISLHSGYAPAYMYLGVCLSLLNDVDNACAVYDKALTFTERADDDVVMRLNYAITLYNSGLPEKARHQFALCAQTWSGLTREQQEQRHGDAVRTAIEAMRTCLDHAEGIAS